jgi:hypothetical protein
MGNLYKNFAVLSPIIRKMLKVDLLNAKTLAQFNVLV